MERILALWDVSSAYGTYPLLMQRILCLWNVYSADGTYLLLTERILCLVKVSVLYQICTLLTNYLREDSQVLWDVTCYQVPTFPTADSTDVSTVTFISFWAFLSFSLLIHPILKSFLSKFP
jgi:hypothetical protein